MEFNPRKRQRGYEEVSQEELKRKKQKDLKPWSDVNGICVVHNI